MGKSTKASMTKRSPTPKKIVLVCEKCGKEFVAEAKTKPPKRCDQCRVTSASSWRLVGFEDSPFGKVRIEERKGKIRKILVE
ncbi:hypothetical protein YS40_088 [Thermus phage phiYS40]|uniref:hypothetical protein n=1 Tax=Thermus phage phiYS40 TaxID=407392 RepID=UPI0000E689CE|nr:hypothetical protein YS40_088 [Thermus phage phiYS40]ABJ91482.1 hypothetical protein YS40_088 [Thermus phage phiYS40]BAK53606.1 hypothetical protein YSP_088 [Thermus phage phiYS40]